MLWLLGVPAVEVGQRMVATANDVLGAHGLGGYADRAPTGLAGRSAGRGRPPQAAARRAGLEGSEETCNGAASRSGT